MVNTSDASKPTGDDWADQITDLLVDTVDKIRDKTVLPVQKASRGVVYGVVILFLAIPSIVLLLAGIVRILDSAIPGPVWYIYLGLGIILSVAGILVWKTKFTKP